MNRCYFCRTAVDDVETAIQLDWIPSFYDGEREVSEPVCPRCASACLRLGNDGEFEPAEHTPYAEWKAKFLASARWCDDMPGITTNPESPE